MKIKKLTTIILPLLVAAINIAIIIHPRESLAAARDGLLLWAQNVLPSLLPFVIGANLLMALGGAAFFGELFSPIMRRLFRVSGGGGFALAIGLMSGYPVGTKVVCEMRESGELGKYEAQRLAAITSNVSPLFVLGAVAVGMFGSPQLGYFMLIMHYLGALTLGLIMRFYKLRGDKKIANDRQYPLHTRAFRAMEAARRKDSRSFGAIFGHCVKNAVETMLIIGGFVVLFSVIAEIMRLSGLLPADYLIGIIEMTNGVYELSAYGINARSVALSVAVISFGGLSILFQSINFISKTDISVVMFVVCKVAHGLFSGVYAALLYPLLVGTIESTHSIAVYYSHSAGTRFVQSSMNFVMLIASLLIIAIGIAAVRMLRRF
ncbi:MAG: hypothetical protein FWE34_08290 [Defluviitaleaceae bacterium]|nr:hypothetical protein [Defluviitaleaceae bacterium]